MRKLFPWAAVGLLAIGCTRIEQGSEAMVYDPHAFVMTLRTPPEPGIDPKETFEIAVGTKVRVIYEGSGPDAWVMVVEGPRQGRSGMLPRDALRPLPR
jgi:hypothetical protein